MSSSINRVGRFLVRIALLGLVAAPVTAQVDPWEPIGFLSGKWRGAGGGLGGDSTVEHAYEFVVQDKFLRMTTRSVFEPPEGGDVGEIHEDVGYFSHDKDNDRLVLRQFLSEGFVNTYVLEPERTDGWLTFTTESTESAGGMRARLKYRLVADDEYEAILELAPPGKEFFKCRAMRMKRVE